MHQSLVRFGSSTWICVHVRKVYVCKTCRLLKYYDELMLWILQLMSHESLLLLITKMRGGCMLWVCVCRCMFLHIMGV